ncbi:unnamed protein product [Eretmochelys imbricata]
MRLGGGGAGTPPSPEPGSLPAAAGESALRRPPAGLPSPSAPFAKSQRRGGAQPPPPPRCLERPGLSWDSSTPLRGTAETGGVPETVTRSDSSLPLDPGSVPHSNTPAWGSCFGDS